MLYNVGDWVTIRPDLDIAKKYVMADGELGIRVVESMRERCGETVQITEIAPSGRYRIADSACGWTDEMFLLPEQLPESDIPLQSFLV